MRTVLSHLSNAFNQGHVERNLPKTAHGLEEEFKLTGFQEQIRRFLFHELHPNDLQSGATLPLEECPSFDSQRIYVHFSAEATYYAPSDPSGENEMCREFIRATPSWRNSRSRYDCVLINQHPNLRGMLGLDVARVYLFFSFKYNRTRYACAFVRWFEHMGDQPDPDTGMWIVKPRMRTSVIYWKSETSEKV